MAQGPRFGTDGIRGRADSEITPRLARALGRAAGEVLGSQVAVIGGDTRESTALLDQALCEGLASAGVDLVRLGVAPTPMVAFIAQQRNALGFVISASHNPYFDNGIKIFGPGGTKLSVEREALIASRLEELLDQDIGLPQELAATVDPDAAEIYLEHLHHALEGRDLSGVHLVVDAANGASSALVRSCFERLGAQVEVINDHPDGRNINASCGATDTAALSATVLRHGADLGLALDGDADRLIAVDERGEIVDGDHIIALCAQDLKARSRLANNTVVVTVMTNLGFHHAMAAAGIDVLQTPVGDRSVLEAMETGGFSLGGEQSGHVIFREQATTGDGLLTGLMLADLWVRGSGRSVAGGASVPFSQLAGEAMTALPQVLINVRLPSLPEDFLSVFTADIAATEARLAEGGRLLVRASGTEPMVRVMVEAPTMELAQTEAQLLADLIRDRYNSQVV
jgi:phosphoglucosamine mutase